MPLDAARQMISDSDYRSLEDNDHPDQTCSTQDISRSARCKVYNRGAVPKEQADSSGYERKALDGVRRRPTEPSYEDEEKIAKKEMYFKSSTIDFIVQGIPQTASETLMENSDKRSLFTDESAGSVGKYYAIVSAMVIRRNPPSLHRVTTLSDPDLSGATYDRNAVPEESHSSLGRMEEDTEGLMDALMTMICGLESGEKVDYNRRERRAPTLSCRDPTGLGQTSAGHSRCAISYWEEEVHSSATQLYGNLFL
ncbi:hypothetical protein L210DRAFT_3508972 [Boletus edulis BED1]|uniref:Uncharacterized protein n=1 Tax=Boletus edulis BED1 TaxID=1328754 RepID=A0AAD4BGI3_BOLED|nr:hypothetical protein L210DRAFT_3508972 [Boletus edulis BED1]